ncbi:MAG: group II intron reverse transcriptase/maturase [Acetobacteraceae bacterium]
MGVKRQQGSVDQRDFLDEALVAALCHEASGDGGTGPGAIEEQQTSTAWEQGRALTRDLMERVVSSANLNQAYKRVKANDGAAGVDGMSTAELRAWLVGNRERLIATLLDGSYQPQPVRGVQIPKPGGGERQLGIPTVVDRLVQQAIAQVLEPILDPIFSGSSFGFRPGRSAHDALRQAREYVADGYEIVVDLDLEKFFDRVNHDILMARLARRIGDKRLLRIVRRCLQAGMMANGVCSERHEGTPQGGPLSPLLANLLLDDLDKELVRRGHRFCRYADDCNIYVRSQAAGERVMASVTSFLEGRLRLTVNQKKSAVAAVGERQFLGHRLGKGGRLGIGRKSLARVKDRCREITRRNRGHVPLGQMIEEVNSLAIGWVTYFRDATCRNTLRELDGWLRRKLRCVTLKRCKLFRTIVSFLMKRGVARESAWRLASSGKGWWRLSDSQQAKQAMPVRWFDSLGLASFAGHHAALNTVGNRRGT